MYLSVCEGARWELGGGEAGACSSDTGRNRKPSAAGPGASARGPGTKPGRRAGLPAGEGQEGAHVARELGQGPPSPPHSHSGSVIPPPNPHQLLWFPPRNIYCLPPKDYQSPYSHPRTREDFFFLKGPGGVGWLVVDEVSACTHRGFCLPWRVKPRLSERGPPPKPRPSVLHCPPQTWAQGPNLAGGPQPGT